MNKYRVGEVVNWFEGRTQRPKAGQVEQVHELAGWPAEYTVRAFKRNGTPAKLTRRMYESELGRGMTADTCCSCHEPLAQPQACSCCYRSVCMGCVQHDGADDTYCPECWTDMQSFIAEGVNGETSESHRHDLPQRAATLPSHGQEQLQRQR